MAGETPALRCAETGRQGLYAVLPLDLSARGIEKIFEARLTEEELVDVMAPKLVCPVPRKFLGLL
jgi:hypothetical protein